MVIGDLIFIIHKQLITRLINYIHNVDGFK